MPTYDPRFPVFAEPVQVWLHRGAYGCAQELATGQPTLKYVNYALDKIRMLRHYKVTPYIVFDGSALPSKLGTELERGKRRSDALAKGNAFLAAGNLAQARDAFVKAVDVTPAMAYQLIKVRSYPPAVVNADPASRRSNVKVSSTSSRPTRPTLNLRTSSALVSSTASLRRTRIYSSSVAREFSSSSSATGAVSRSSATTWASVAR